MLTDDRPALRRSPLASGSQELANSPLVVIVITQKLYLTKEVQMQRRSRDDCWYKKFQIVTLRDAC